MPEQSRQLAAIMFTDIVGYTLLMGEDEERAFELLKKNRQVQRPIIEKYGGRWLKEIGDGILASFPTVSAAVYCAKAIQEACLKEDDLKLRIGIHQGEVVFEDDDVFGDGVNIASRLEPLAPIGGILVSESVNRNLGNKKGIETKFLREENLRNVKKPVKIYEVMVEGVIPPKTTSTTPSDSATTPKDKKRPSSQRKLIFTSLGIILILSLVYRFYSHMDKQESLIQLAETKVIDKSIAVLPFRNDSPDQNNEYFCNGMLEEILDRLVAIPDLKVTSRTSVMHFKGTDKLLRTIGAELGVAHVLEGSVRKFGNKLRIAVQLIDVETDQHLWSKIYERDLEDVFIIQSEVAQQVAFALKTEIQPEIRLKFELQPTTSMEAYEFYLQGKYIFYNRFQLTWKIQDFEISERMYKKALEIDPNYGLAHAGLADLYNSYRKSFIKEGSKKEKYLNFQKKEITLAYELDPYSDYVNQVKGWVHLEFGEIEEAYYSFKTAVQMNPKNSWNLISLTTFLLEIGFYDESLVLINAAIKVDPLNSHGYIFRGIIHMHSGKYDIALAEFRQSSKIDPDNVNAYYFLSVLYELRKDEKEAQKVWEIINSLNPDVQTITTTKKDILGPGPDLVNRINADFVIANLLLGNNDVALDALVKDQTLFNFYILDNLPVFDQLRDDPIFKDLLEQKRNEYDSLSDIYGGTEFLRNLTNKDKQ